MGEKKEQTGLFNLDIATGLGKRKLREKIDLVSNPARIVMLGK